MPTKRYYSKIPGSRFVFKDGTENYFNYGFAEISNPDHQAELDAILGKNPMIYTQEQLKVEQQPIVPQAGRSEAEIASQDARFPKTGVRVSGDAQTVVGTGLPSSADVNTVDPALKAEVMTIVREGSAPAPSGSLAARREAIKQQ